MVNIGEGKAVNKVLIKLLNRSVFFRIFAIYF